jgi:serine-type D-Ala-D-Ala endopeptidase (penicillin-binding protein 7)
MKHKFRTALLLGALAGLGLNAPLQAAPAKKSAHHVAKKGESAAGQKAHAANKEAGHSGLAKNSHGKKVLKSAKAAPYKPGKATHAIAHVSKQPIRRVSLADVDPSRLALYSSSALVIDQSTGRAILEKHSDAVTPIASISKLMTAMVVLDAKLDLNEVIAIGEEDVDGLKGTRSRLPVGTTMTRETAMLLALMASENRAAHALGRHYPGGLSAFVVAMNRKAQMLGMSNSRFEEPTGLSSNNVSTAHDLARMVAAAARYPEIRSYSTTGEARVELNGRISDFHNTNALVRSENWEIGLSKTGYISEAGRCLVMQARVADKPVVIVLLDSVGKMTRVGDANRIKRWMENASLDSGKRSS